jgi:hypothetical protein
MCLYSGGFRFRLINMGRHTFRVEWLQFDTPLI